MLAPFLKEFLCVSRDFAFSISNGVNGGGVFVNLAPSRYTLNHLNLPQSCTPMLGWGEASSMSFEVMANRVAYARVECMEPSSP